MKYKVFLNNPNRKWEEDSDIVWLCINDKFSMPYKKNQILLWPHVHDYLKNKYGSEYDVAWQLGQGMPVGIYIVTNLTENPLGNETGNQVVASGNEEVQQQIV